MRPVLLLVPDRDVPLRLRHTVETCSAGAIDRDTEYASVVVLNDGRAGTVQRLREALALRDHRPELQIGVLSWLDTHSAASALALAASLSSALGDPAPELKVELKEQVLSVEYQT